MIPVPVAEHSALWVFACLKGIAFWVGAQALLLRTAVCTDDLVVVAELRLEPTVSSPEVGQGRHDVLAGAACSRLQSSKRFVWFLPVWHRQRMGWEGTVHDSEYQRALNFEVGG